MEAITTVVESALGTVQTNAIAMMGAALPFALCIMGMYVVITAGVRLFKRIAK